MKQFHLTYSLSFTFSNDVNHHYFKCKCLPGNDQRQHILSNKVKIDADFFSYTIDGLNNPVIYGYKEQNHNSLHIHIDSLVQVDWSNYDKDTKFLDLFTLDTKLTKWNPDFEILCQNLPESDYEKACILSKRVYEYMNYEKNSTTINTSAYEAFQNKKGVCQDYAHILIALLRRCGIPSRYVAGVLSKQSLTHAWVEFYANNRWYGLDPTNDLLIDDYYISFAKGRDCKDTMVNKGIFYGYDIQQIQNVHIEMEEWEQ